MAEVLVPIRINVDQDGFKFRDAFTWNVNDTTIKVCVLNCIVCVRTYACMYGCMYVCMVVWLYIYICLCIFLCV